MSSANQVDVVLTIELFDDVLTEKVAGTTRTYTPASDFIRV